MRNNIVKNFILATLLLSTPFGTNCLFDSAKAFLYNNKEGITAFCFLGGMFSLPFLFCAYDNYKEDQKSLQLIIRETQTILDKVTATPFVNDAQRVLDASVADDIVTNCVEQHCPGFRLPFLSYFCQLEKLLTQVVHKQKSLSRRLQCPSEENQEFQKTLANLNNNLKVIKNKLESLRVALYHHKQYYREKDQQEREEWQTHNYYSTHSF